jgi:alpha-glucosidase
LKFKGTKKEMVISQYKDGKFTTEYETLRFNFIGLPFEIDYVEVDNAQVSLEDLQYDRDTQTMMVNKEFSEFHVVGK